MNILVVDGLNIATRRLYARLGTERAPVAKDYREAARDAVKAMLTRQKKDSYEEVWVALDSDDCWRYGIYPDYKYAVSNPKPRIAQELQGYLTDELGACKIPAQYAVGMEADDVIASMMAQGGVQFLRQDSQNTIDIWTNDSDIYQVLDRTLSNLQILKEGSQSTTRDIRKIDGQLFKLEMNIPPSAIPLFKALVGDKSDNLLGVKGIGPKTAAIIISDWPPHEIDPEVTGEKAAKAILAAWDQIERDTEIATLITDAELERL